MLDDGQRVAAVQHDLPVDTRRVRHSHVLQAVSKRCELLIIGVRRVGAAIRVVQPQTNARQRLVHVYEMQVGVQALRQPPGLGQASLTPL